jgi:hypothetical protein
MVRKGGFEPPRLSAPPPQDGVSASSTTSAKINDLQALFNIYTLPDGRTSSGSECCAVSIYGQRECGGMTDVCRSSRNDDCVGARGCTAGTHVRASAAAIDRDS